MMTTSTSSALSETAAGCTNETSSNIPPRSSDIHKMLMNKIAKVNGSLAERLRSSSNDQFVHLNVNDLLHHGSAVLRDISSSFAVHLEPMSHLPSLNPLIQDCFSLAISQFICRIMINAERPSSSKGSQGLSSPERDDSFIGNVCNPDANFVDKMTIDESVIKSEVIAHDEDTSDSGSSAGVANAVGHSSMEDYFITREGHKNKLTRDVPEEVFYSVRGVRCCLCNKTFRNPKAVDLLIDHTKRMHPKRATGSFLRSLRRENAFNKLIGKGMMYCTCTFCKTFGHARIAK